MKKTLLADALLGCLLGIQATNLRAAFSITSADDAASTLEPVIVTATRTAITADEALSSVTVIARADIERLQPISVIDLLQGLPGVTFVQSGGIGQQSSLFLRGTNSNHTLILIDGVRIGNVNFGLAAFEQIPVEQIERIEIVRGPRSSLYGADAIGGVIQILTRHGQAGGGLAPSLSVTAGNRSFVRGEVGLSGGDAHAWYNLSLGGEYTSGIPACRMGAAEAGAACFVDDPRDDAYRNWNGTANGGYRWDNGTELALTWLRSKSDAEYAGGTYGGNQTVNQQEVAGARLSFNPLELWKVTLNVGQSRDDSSTFFQGLDSGQYYSRTPVGYANSRRNQASWQNDFSLNDFGLATNQLLTVGTDYQQEHISSDTGYLDSTRGDAGSYAQYQGTFGHNNVQLSARHDHNSQFGNHDTGAVAWGYAFDYGLRLSASYGSAFHAPTFNDLYFPPFGSVPSANPNLKPETSRSTELGLTQKSDYWNWAVNAYQTKINQLITLDANYFPLNISRARIRGIEGQFGFELGGWQVQNYLTLLQPKNDDGGIDDGKLLPRRPEQTGRIDVDRNFGRFSIGGTFNADSKRYDDLANQHRLGGYTTADLRAGYAFAKDWRVEARLANLFDHQYETAYYYNQLGRSWFLTLRYSPKG